jgi:type VI secretion system protein ImpL
VTEGHVVHGAYSKDGFTFMQDAMKNPGRYANGEQWVLGVQQQQTQGAGNLSADLATLYSAYFLNEWHLFLTDAHVLGCGGLHDASGKLSTLAGANSPLLELFYTVSHNTAVSDTDIKTMFQPAQQMADPNNPDKLVGGGNQQYVAALTALSSAVDSVSTSVAQNPPSATDPAAYASITTAVTAAKQATDTSAQSFNRDDPQFKVGSTLKQLMLEPIQCVGKIPPSPGGKANAGGEKICGAVRSLLGKYPFALNRPPDASLDEVNKVFTPVTGTAFTADDGALKPYLTLQVAQYAIVQNPPQQVNPKFKDYLNRVAAVSSKLYPLGAKNPTIAFTLKFLSSSPGAKNATFKVDDKPVPSGVPTTWSAGQKVSLLHDSNESLQNSDAWSLFELVRRGKPRRLGANSYQLDYLLIEESIQGESASGPGKPISFELSGQGADLLVGEASSGLSCVGVGPVVKQP